MAQYVFQMHRVGKVVPPKKQILSNISLSFFPGAKIGVLGLNGAGKSSLLRIMGGVDKDFEGEAVPLKDLKIGFLTQEPELDADKDVRGNVEEGLGETVGLLERFNEISMKFAEPMSDDEMTALLEEQGELQNAIDAVGGLWCVNLGYSNNPIKDAIAKQLYDLPYSSNFAGSTNPCAIEASLAVRDMFAEDGMARVFFTSGGSDSVETALRLSRQYHRLRNEPTRTKFLSLKKGYHGTHFGGASVNGNNRFRINYEPLMPGC
ncbi:MAG: aminotransferase class III-fold pyridoxal phosphate-dependent enzyme, partial [Gammaproteobacteria bacterium]